MKAIERFRIAVKALEFRMPPRASRWVLRASGVSSPYRQAEHRMRCIFVHVPKAAGTSIARALFEDKSRHICISRYYAFDPAAAAAYFKFAFVRNPWDRFASAYHYLARRVGADPRYPDHRWATHYLAGLDGFSGFVERMSKDSSYRRQVMRYIHFREQCDWLVVPGRGDALAVDFVGRFERMEDDFTEICGRMGITAALPHERQGEKRDYRNAYSTSGVELISRLYPRDIKAFGYRFGD